MRLTIERGALLKALNHVQSVVERRNTIPILSNVLLTAENGFLNLSATDLDIEMVDGVEAEIERPGAITAPAHTFYEIVRKLPEGSQVRLDLSGEDPRLTLSAGRSRFSLPVLPAGDFPVMASGPLDVRFHMDRGDLGRLIDRTRFAISTEETRYYLNGIYLHAVMDAGQPLLRAVATDGHRLALSELPMPDGAAGMPGVIVPRKTVAELRRLLDDAVDEVEVSVSDSKIRFTAGRTVLTSKLIDGSFPDYARVIPRDNQRHMAVDRKLFAQSVDRVATISAERSRSVKMALDDGRLTLTVNNPESGLAVDEVEAHYDGLAMEVGFNAKYLLDITAQIAGDTAVFEFADPASPTLVRDKDDNSAKYVLMPLRV